MRPEASDPQVLAVVGTSARLLAQGAAELGWQAHALDCFGDADTRAASTSWQALGDPATLAWDTPALCEGLRRARAAGAQAWVAGSGMEAHPEALAAGAQLLPLWGVAPGDVLRVRDPRGFFCTLAQLGLPHPEVRHSPPADPAGWWHKRSRGSGGWHIQPATAVTTPVGADGYWQAHVAGEPVSLCWLATADGPLGARAHWQAVGPVLGPQGQAHPLVFQGVSGPIDLPEPLMQHLIGAAAALTRVYRLRGWVGLDLMLDGDRFWLLELNPRPTASLGLSAPGWLAAQRSAARGGVPRVPCGEAQAQALRYVYTRAPLRLDARVLAALAAWPGAQDLPAGQTGPDRLPMGVPLCSLSAPPDPLARSTLQSGPIHLAQAQASQQQLARQADALWRHLTALAGQPEPTRRLETQP